MSCLETLSPPPTAVLPPPPPRPSVAENTPLLKPSPVWSAHPTQGLVQLDQWERGMRRKAAG